MLEIREMVVYAIPRGGFTGIPGPVITTTTPDDTVLVVSRDSASRVLTDSIVFMALVEKDGVTAFYLTTWNLDGDVNCGDMGEGAMTLQFDPARDVLAYGLE
jgi:hypothetical protein